MNIVFNYIVRNIFIYLYFIQSNQIVIRLFVLFLNIMKIIKPLISEIQEFCSNHNQYPTFKSVVI